MASSPDRKDTDAGGNVVSPGTVKIIDMTFDSNWDEVVESFDGMNLKRDLLKGLYAHGFERPSAIQQRAIIPCINGRDLIVQAPSGTDRLAAFSIAILNQIDPGIGGCQALILAPTRDLALQIHKLVSMLGEYLSVRCLVCIGGSNVRDNVRQLKHGGRATIVVGTPGRVMDLINRNALRTESIRSIVVEEADGMLSSIGRLKGFKEQTEHIFQRLNENIQIIFLSSIVSSDVLETASIFVKDPVRILIKPVPILDGIRHFYVSVEREECKLEIALSIYAALTTIQAVIFCNVIKRVVWLTNEMKGNLCCVSALHGNMDQRERAVTMQEFVSGSSRVLITTDAFSCSINMEELSLVINYDFPTNINSYVNRIGGGQLNPNNAVVINFVRDKDTRILSDIEKFCDIQIEQMPKNMVDILQGKAVMPSRMAKMEEPYVHVMLSEHMEKCKGQPRERTDRNKPKKSSARKGENTAGIAVQLADEVVKQLNCRSCSQLMEPPIGLCQAGHPICSKCKEQLPGCPSCQAPFLADARNFSLEQLTNHVIYQCTEIGCSDEYMRRDKDKHASACAHRVVKCAADACDWSGKHALLPAHVTDAHGSSVSV